MKSFMAGIALLGSVLPVALASATGTNTGAPTRSYITGALIFNGKGTSASDANSLVKIIESKGLSYKVVNSDALNAMSVDDLAKYGVIVWPGGHANQMTDSLTYETRRNIRKAVRESGVNFAGFCAGAWMGVGDDIPLRGDLDIGFALLPGKLLAEYFPNGKEPTAEMVQTSFADGSQRDLVWWGGPITPNIPGGVVAKYPDGSPEITQAFSGNGFVVLTGTHPEAPQGWRDGEGLSDKDGLDFELAWKLVNSALTQLALPAF
ncbi:MAG: hypothetical protein HY074_13600 [Deltaproteobacteria bacterium]|nr:hypothetical protein [Deltaproteobacteria bacterium]